MRCVYRANPAKFCAISKANRTANPESIKIRRARMLRSRYNLTPEDFEILRRKQKNRCAICGKLKTLETDHCHKTNKVRGLLCGNCNRGIGCMKESIDNFLRAIQYLLRHS